MVAIARSESGRVNPTDLSFELRLNQSAFQAALRDLVEVGLLQRNTDGRRTIYVRQTAKIWDWILEVDEQLRTEVSFEAPVHRLRTTP